jgi:hypothetical protein
MRLVQFWDGSDKRRVGLVAEDGATLKILAAFESVYELALAADRVQSTLATLLQANLSGETADYAQLIEKKRLLPPLDHPDPAHCLVTGTGLTHLGSAKARDEMHNAEQAETATSTDSVQAVPITDSMRIFQWGLEGGKPAPGEISVQPEWFYKGNGHCVVAPERPFLSPSFALDGGEEPELVGLYVIGETGNILRVGFALGNEFSDHVMEKQNYLYLAHSKLRPCSFGPELLVGDLPHDVQGDVRIWRGGEVVWQRPFVTGEANMSYRIEALEHHHFKYADFRRPGDVHCHFFGTGTLSFADGIQTQAGDLFEIEAADFGRPLRNALQIAEEAQILVSVQTL